MRKNRLLFLSSAAACLIASTTAPALTTCAFAADSSRWDNDSRSAVRLLAARPRVVAGVYTLRAGVEIKLQPGWKVYGRDPIAIGAPRNKWDLDPLDKYIGVPPQFDFAGSENFKRIVVLWPEPTRFTDGEYYSLGYMDSVVLPLHVEPIDRKKPVTVRLKLDYAVCDVLSVPAKAKVELVFSDKDGAFDAAVSAAEARVKN